MYCLTGDEKYAQRAWEELESACEFPDWNQKHYLDTGGMMAAAAIGYDWFYDYLSEAQREKLQNAILEKGVKIGLDIYRGKYNAVYLMSFWINSPYNWNAHCNAGLIMASLAIGNAAPEITGPVLEDAMRSFEYAANEFEPDGAWEEGPSHWNTNVQDDVRIISSLETALGTEYGYFNIPGIRETCYYPVYVMGPHGTFNYSDSDKTKRLEIQHQFWMAEHLPDPNLGYLRKTYIEESNYKCTPSDLIWYRPEYCAQKLKDLDTDRYFRKVDTATMRSSWDNEAMFVGFHSGNTDIPHSHLDTGSFMLDYGGVRWVEDLGTDRITYTGTGGYRPYRSRAEGHNTLVMDNSNYKGGGQPAGRKRLACHAILFLRRY